MSEWLPKPRTSKRRSSSGSNRESPVKSLKTPALKALIVDNGAYTIKIGYSKDEEPRIIPNCIMKAKSERKRLFIGQQVEECRDCSGLYFLLPCERGYITHWEVQKPVWDHIFSKNVFPIEENPVILTQPMFNFKSIQDCIDEIFFEEYEVPSLFRCNPTDLAYLNFAKANKLTKNDSVLVIDCGFSFTHIIPYIRGNKFLRACKRLNVGGKLLTNHLKDIISYRQYNVMEETYVINQVKEDTCYVCPDIKKELAEASKPFNSNNIVKNYVLPDFNTIRRGYIQVPDKKEQNEYEDSCQILRLNNERFIVPEILFHPSDIGMKSMGIAEAAVKSIYSCSKEYRKSLAKHVVIVGGNCKFPGFKDRMFAELRSLLPDIWQVNVFQPEDPIKYTWKGGHALLRTHDFKSNIVTKQDYEELGSTIIQDRFNNFMLDDSRLENTEDSGKPQESFNYLSKLKSPSIFGKTDPQNIQIDQTKSENDVTVSSGQSDVTNNAQTSEKDDFNITVTNDVTQDAFFTSESDKITKRVRGSRAKGVEEFIFDFEVESNDEDDLTQSVELFPFGTRSYL